MEGSIRAGKQPNASQSISEAGAASAQGIRDALARVLASDQFESAKRAREFLSFVVEESVAGRGDRIKGYTIATEVFGRAENFDHDNDTIVRVQAGQIRRRLSLYYADNGRNDPIRILLPKGSYAPQFAEAKTQGDSNDRTVGRSGSLGLPRGPAIAVLPFENLSSDKERGLFGDGIAEEIINDLTKFRDLQVVARRTMLRYQGQSVDIQQLGEDLGVEYVLCGSVRSVGSKVRVSVQLVDTATNTNIFTEQYGGELTAQNLLDLQEAIADDVVAKLAEPYGVIARLGQHGRHRQTIDHLDSYASVLRYYQFEARPTPKEHERLRSLLEEATRRDPQYAGVWAALAAIYLDEHRYGFNVIAARPALPLALKAAETAVRLDPQSSMAHHFLFCTRFHTGDRRGFFEAGERALQLNPNHSDMLADFGFYRALIGDWDGGLPLARKAVAISVIPPGWYHLTFCLNHCRLDRFDEALADAMRLRSPAAFFDPLMRAICHAQLGQLTEAQAAAVELEQISPGFARSAASFFSRIYMETALQEKLLAGLRKAQPEG